MSVENIPNFLLFIGLPFIWKKRLEKLDISLESSKLV